MALPTGMTLRQQTPSDIPAMVGLVDEVRSVLYGRTGYYTADGLALGLARPLRDPERDNPAIFAGDRMIAWAALQAWPPMSEVVCPIVDPCTWRSRDEVGARDVQPCRCTHLAGTLEVWAEPPASGDFTRTEWGWW